MFGSLYGNIIGIGFFFIFQILGIFISARILHKENPGFALLIGSVIGSFSLQWLPVLFAFFTGFTITSHVFALLTMFLLTTAVYVLGKRHWGPLSGLRSRLSFRPRELFLKDPALFFLIPLWILTAVILTGHTLPVVDGTMHSGQSTYGDMNMHLGFITSLAKQQTFPPEYSILPGTRLAYPFLSDSISSSIYLWGSSLRIAYLVPMYTALLQVFLGAYALAKQLLYVVNKSYGGKTILALIFFFLNGGFGFYYFINEGFNSENFRRIFSAFYETPTNYVQENIQWHNIICDMLIPQRATLFGWAVLFPLLVLLFRGRKKREPGYFLLAGILAGGLVLIHTHSFLALGILCSVFLLQDLRENHSHQRSTVLHRFIAVAAFAIIMSLFGKIQQSQKPLEGYVFLLIGGSIAAVFAGAILYFLYRGYSRNILLTWGIFLGAVIVCALPQLLGFTFQQAQGEQFVRGAFNWANEMDGYLLFNLKNWGVLFLLTLLTIIFGTKKQLQIALPGCLLWIICEFILFQPNPYDNNKLLLVAYLFFCIAAADFVWETIPQLSKKYARQLRIASVAVTASLASFAAILTIGREYVSDYELYDKAYVEMCQWVEENTDPSDIFLTATNHNNAISSLTGRNIVCGSGSFLYYHGINYAQNEADVRTMYEDASQRDALLSHYEVSYIVLGPVEWGTYQIPDLLSMYETYDVVYNENNIVILAVPEPQQ